MGELNSKCDLQEKTCFIILKFIYGHWIDIKKKKPLKTYDQIKKNASQPMTIEKLSQCFDSSEKVSKFEDNTFWINKF